MKNYSLDEKDKSVLIKINSNIYPLEVIYSAAYVFLDRAYVIIDSGDSKEEILVQLKAKEPKQDLEEIAQSFNNELVSYAVYVVQAARSSSIRQAIVEAALSPVKETEESEFIEDPLGIAKPWTPEAAKGLEIPDEVEEKRKKQTS